MDNTPKPGSYMLLILRFNPSLLQSSHSILSLSSHSYQCLVVQLPSKSMTYQLCFYSELLNHIDRYSYLLNSFNIMSQRYFKQIQYKTNYNIHSIPAANLTFIQHFPISLLPLPTFCKSASVLSEHYLFYYSSIHYRSFLIIIPDYLSTHFTSLSPSIPS